MKGYAVLWIALTVGAAFLQNVRSALQKSLKGKLGTGGATFVRFIYGFPFALLYFAVLTVGFDFEVPEVNARFLLSAAVGGVAQIVATALLVSLFDKRNFAVGTTYSKTETVQAALFAIVFLGETISLSAAVGILISLCGVIAISAARGIGGSNAGSSGGPLRALLATLGSRSAAIGLASGAAFGISAVAYRAASLSLNGETFLIQAAMTLVCVLAFQSIVMAVYLALRTPTELSASFRAWKAAIWVGASGAAASVGWFTAMTLQNVALVRALGQIELVFTLAASWLIFRERIVRWEMIGIVLVTAGILVILLGRV
ncbi:MAG: EamA family transporter [Pseudomonadota bacterium]